jgi:ribosomal protein L11 methylase PrmA
VSGRLLALALLTAGLTPLLAGADPPPRGPRAAVPFVSTPHDVVEKMLELAKVGKDDVVADLGCGDGRIVVAAAKKYGCKAYGCDLDRKCVRLALENVKAAGVEKLVTIEAKNVFDVDLRDFTVVTLYLGPAMNIRLIPQLEKLKPGARIVSHGYPTPGLVADKTETVVSADDAITRKLYLWTTPLKKEPKKE